MILSIPIFNSALCIGYVSFVLAWSLNNQTLQNESAAQGIKNEINLKETHIYVSLLPCPWYPVNVKCSAVDWNHSLWTTGQARSLYKVYILDI